MGWDYFNWIRFHPRKVGETDVLLVSSAARFPAFWLTEERQQSESSCMFLFLRDVSLQLLFWKVMHYGCSSRPHFQGLLFDSWPACLCERNTHVGSEVDISVHKKGAWAWFIFDKSLHPYLRLREGRQYLCKRMDSWSLCYLLFISSKQGKSKCSAIYMEHFGWITW